MGTGELSLRMQGPRCEGGHFHVVARLRISGAILSPYPWECVTCTGTALVCLGRGVEEVYFVNVTRDQAECCSKGPPPPFTVSSTRCTSFHSFLSCMFPR